jgi:hypothetical protein
MTRVLDLNNWKYKDLVGGILLYLKTNSLFKLQYFRKTNNIAKLITYCFL